MFTKSMLAIFFAVAMAALTIASDTSDTVKVGDSIILHLTGKLAIEMAKRIGTVNGDGTLQDGLEMEFSAVVCQELKGRQLRVEGEIPSIDKHKLITLSIVVDANQVKQIEIPKGPIYGSPGDKQNGIKPVRLDKPMRSQQLELSDLKQVKLRVWTLSEETGG